MPDILVPRRRRGVEFLDDPAVDPALVRRSLRDVARSNTLFGGAHAVLAELHHALKEHVSAIRAPRGDRARNGAVTPLQRRDLTLLDVGIGAGDIPRRAEQTARRFGVKLVTVGLDESETLARMSRRATIPTIRGDALSLPIADGGVDFVTCSQVLHHFSDDLAHQVVRELDRVARIRVIISDIRRSWLAAGGIWVASFPLGFHPVSRHDGVVSVLRGYTPAELSAVVASAIGRPPTVRRRLGFRVTACWTPEAGR